MVKISRLLALLGFCLATSVYANERIISLKPNITDILLRLGVTDELVGVTTYCTLPASLPGIARVSDYIKPNLEKVVALRPTVVFGAKENSQQKEIERLQALGIRVELLVFASIDDIYQSIDRIAEVTERKQAGEALVVDLRARWQRLAGRSSRPQRLLLIVGQSPLVAASGRTVFQPFLDQLRLINVLGSSVVPYPYLSKEQVVALDPEWIVDISAADPNDASGNASGTALAFYRDAFRTVTAVKRRHVRVLPAALFLPGPSLWEGMEQLVSIVQ